MSLSAGGRFDDPLRFGPFALDAGAFDACWASATAGGAVDRDTEGVQLWLTGTRTVNGALPGAAAAEGPAGRASQSLLPWRGAIGVYDAGYVSVEESLQLYRQAAESALRHAAAAQDVL
jgi:hypothetical protein